MPETNPFQNPITQLQEGMAQMHEVFLSAMQVGFTEQQAMTIVLEIMRQAQGQGA